MIEHLVSFVLGGVCWKYRAEILELGKKLYNDLVTDDAVVEPQKKESTKEE